MIIKNEYKSAYIKLLNNFVAILFFSALIIIMIIVYVANMGFNKKHLFDSDEKMKIISIIINNFYEQIDDDINMMVDNPVIKKFDETVTKYTEPSTNKYITPSINGGIEQDIYNIFENYGSNHFEIKNIYMASKDGRYIRWPEIDVNENFNPLDTDWYKRGLEGNGDIIRLYPRMDLEKGTVISNLRTVYDNEGNLIGVLGIDIRKDIISNIIEPIRIGSTGYFLLVDDNKTILADGGNNKNNFVSIENAYGKELEKIFNENIPEFKVQIKNEPYIVTSKVIKNTNMTIACIISEKEIKKYINILMTALIPILLVIIIFMLFIIFYSIKKIVMPINKCAEYLVEIGEGNFTQDINPEYLEREDEIGIIANGINDMKSSLIVLIYKIKNELRIFKKIADESKHNCIIIYDEDYNLIYTNKVADEYIEIYKKQNKDTYKTKIFIDVDNEILSEIREGLDEHEHWIGIIEMLNMGITLNCSVQKLNKDEYGKKYIVVIFDDITEKLKSERKLVKYEEMKSQEILRSKFFANISHELRTPLNIFQSTLQILDMKIDKDASEVDELYLKYSHTLKTNCNRMLRLINNIVDMSKIDAGFTKAKFADHDIVMVVEEITMSVVNYAKRKKITVIFDTKIEELIIKCDLDMIERIMLNLLSNAIKFTNVKGNILVDMRADDEWVYIKVKDDGIGIPLEMQSNIFDRFIQSDKSFNRLNEGSGIGLAIVHSLVELNEGKIYLYSDGEHGTEFEIMLPNEKLNIEEELDTIYEVDVQNTELELSDILT